jgi:hypothetical protein
MALSRKFTVITIGIILLYLIAAYIHIKNTGYYFAEVATKWKIRKEYNAFLANTQVNIANPRFENIKKSGLTAFKLDDHSLARDAAKKDKDGNPDLSAFTFTTKGILLDEDLPRFISAQQTNGQRAIIAETGLRLQLDYYGIGMPKCDNPKNATASN